MSDEPKKPQGLDLSKLLKQKKADALPAEPAPPPDSSLHPTPTEPPAKPAGLNLSQLLAKKTQPAAITGASGDTEALGLLFGIGRKEEIKTVGRPATPRPQPKPQPPVKPATPTAGKPTQPSGTLFPKAMLPRDATVDTSQKATAFAASVETAASREGAKGLRLDMVVAQDRLYPRGYFGIDEVFVHYDILFDVVRRHMWRLRADHKQRFTIGYRVVGSSFFQCTLRWDAATQTLTEALDVLPEDATVFVTHDADTVIDQIRGRVSCNRMLLQNPPRVEGDTTLLYWLAVNLQQLYSRDMYDALMETELKAKQDRMALLKDAKDAVDAVTALFEIHAKGVAQAIEEPLFLRLLFQTEPRVDVLLHFQDGKMNTLRGKPGEELVPGACEFHIDPIALRTIAEGESNLYFNLVSNHIKITGDLQLLASCKFVDHEQSMALLAIVNKTGKPLDRDNRIPGTINLRAPPRDPYLDLY